MRDWGTYLDGPGFGDALLRIGGTFVQVWGNPNVARIRKEAVPYVDWATYYVDKPTPEQFRERIYLHAKYGARVNIIAPLPARARPGPGSLRGGALGIVATVIPSKYIWMYGADPEQGVPKHRRGADPQNRENFQPYRSLMKAGVPVVLSTDNAPPNAFFVMWTAIARKTRDGGRVVTPGERLRREDALRAMTINGAYLVFDEQERGSIEKGKYADLAVLSEDYLTVPEDRIKDIQVVMTMLGGKIVYEAKRPA